MKTHILTGSKSEIVELVARIEGQIREVIVIVDDLTEPVPPPIEEDIFAEMDQYTVNADGVDYSRESIYSQLESE